MAPKVSAAREDFELVTQASRARSETEKIRSVAGNGCFEGSYFALWRPARKQLLVLAGQKALQCCYAATLADFRGQDAIACQKQLNRRLLRPDPCLQVHSLPPAWPAGR